MSSACLDRSGRWQEIEKGLQFIQSTLPFPGSQEQYEIFIQDLVKNLFGEGNDVFHEGEWARSVELYTEALNIAEYADSEDIVIACDLREKLYANRAASYLNIGLHDQALEDCEKALQLNENNHRALYRKARSLKEVGRHQEAYEAVAKCSMAVPQDTCVIQLTQELAKMLGLKIRKAYVRGKPALNVLSGSSISGAANEKQSQISASVEDIETDVCHSKQAVASSLPVSMPLCPPASEKVEVEPQPAPVNIISTVPPIEPHNPEPVPVPVHMPLVNGSRPSESYPVIESQLDFDAEIIGDDLDELLDSAAPADPSVVIPTVKGPLPLPTSIASVSSMSAPLHLPPHMNHPMLVPTQCTVNLPALYNKPVSPSYSLGLDTFTSPLDSLDSLSISKAQPGFGQHTFMMGNNERTLAPMPPMGMPFGMPESSSYAQELPQQVDLAKNPLADTHEFKQACSTCFKTGPGVLDYSYHPEDHKCKKDLLLGRIKHSDNPTWKLIRPRPTKNQYVGPYYICKDVVNGEECKYRGHCTFAYCQEEIDVWTLERKGFISRDLLCDPYGARTKVSLSVPKILQEHHGIFMFLCQVCFDHKPRIISKLNKENPALCSHPVTKHVFEDHKCLVHVLKDITLSYSKIRPYSPTCQLDLCRHAVRYGCQREDYCFYAHSLIELKVWVMQREQGITHESIVQEAKKYWNIESSSQVQELPPKRFGPSNLKMQFVCEQCWRNGQVSEPDKNRKYCSAKSRHTWSKDRQVVLVSSVERRKWTQIRPLPTRKPAPSQFEICMHVAAGKKCQYIGNCTFAHSPEEKDLWTYMKDNNIADMGQLYELWLQSQKPSCSAESSISATKENGKQIHMPTDYADEMAGNHCWLCGKNCNSDKQWQQHITSEKHKDRLFNSEVDLNCWQYRFPTGTFKVCERFQIGTCTEEDQCKLAHGEEELKEWQDRREFLLQRLAKAQNDHLLAPNDNDFGKYSFLLKDLK
ncbi:zinc finger CCCH domain-containing protein 7A isoform X2 [Salminus brasiliensis]|uniref:zinc finger CCCH domain-containing protein 7A isoform X2 n=1 Tax=Salminus brasiliensis TaxID=930266 RepID=UPI003B8339CD